MRALSTFPEVGNAQCHMGRINGIYRTWHSYNGNIGKRHIHSDRAQAFEVHDANIEVLKVKKRVNKNG